MQGAAGAIWLSAACGQLCTVQKKCVQIGKKFVDAASAAYARFRAVYGFQLYS